MCACMLIVLPEFPADIGPPQISHREFSMEQISKLSTLFVNVCIIIGLNVSDAVLREVLMRFHVASQTTPRLILFRLHSFQ